MPFISQVNGINFSASYAATSLTSSYVDLGENSIPQFLTVNENFYPILQGYRTFISGAVSTTLIGESNNIHIDSTGISFNGNVSLPVGTYNITASQALTASLTISSSFATSASRAVSASFATSASRAVSASFATSSSFSTTSLTSSYSTTLGASISNDSPGQIRLFNSAGNTISSITNLTASLASTASTITGGTSNYIPLWSDNITLGSSVFYQNGTNIGLGTLTPNTNLHILTSSAQPLLNIQNTLSTGYSNMRFTGTGRNFIIGVGNASETTFGVANDFFIYDDTAGLIRMVMNDKGEIGIGTISPSVLLDVTGTTKSTLLIGPLITAAGTTSVAPIRILSGSNLTTPASGAIEYDGTVLYSTNDASSQRGYMPSTQIFRLTGNGTTITTIANFFGANSAIQLAAGGVYEIEAYCYLAKVTLSGTVTITITTSAAPVNLSGIVQFGLLTNGGLSGTANQIALFNSTAASSAFAASGTLTTSQNHAFIIRLIVEANANASNLRFNFTSNAGGLTPLRNSYYKVTKLPSGNVGNFVT